MKRRYLILLLAGCLLLTGCNQQEAEQIPTGEGPYIYGGGEIIETPTYKNGSKYTPFGKEESFITPDGKTCTFHIPDREIFLESNTETYKKIRYNEGLIITYGSFENLQEDSTEKLIEQAEKIASEYRKDHSFEIYETAPYVTENGTFHTITGISKYKLSGEENTQWMYLMGTPVTEQTYLFWIVEEEGLHYTQFLEECENIMLTYEVAE